MGRNAALRWLTLLCVGLFLTPVALADAADYQAFASRIVKSLNERDAEAFNAVLDADALLERALDSPDIHARTRRDFKAGFLSKRAEIGSNILAQMPAGAYARLVRVAPAKSSANVLVRFDYGDQGYGFSDWEVRRDAAGQLAIVDWFEFASGQRYSATLGQLATLAQPEPGVVGRVLDYVRGIKSRPRVVSDYVTAIREQRHAEAFSLYDTMPKALKADRTLLFMLVMTGNRSGDEGLYRKALGHVALHHGRNPDLTFLLLDHLFLAERYAEAAESLERFETYIGAEDAAVTQMKANAHLLGGDTATGVQLAARAVEMEPTLEAAYWSLLLGLTQLGDFTAAVEVLAVLESRFQYDMSPQSLGAAEQYQTLIESQAYRSWRALP